MEESDDPGWSGVWNGYFGKGVKNADLETFFVLDDDPDEEFEFYPDANDSSRRGLGTQIYVRSLQWNNILTESHNFWLYEVLNEGTTTYDSMYFALFADFKIGGWDEDVAGYHTLLDVAFCYDYDNTAMCNLIVRFLRSVMPIWKALVYTMILRTMIAMVSLMSGATMKQEIRSAHMTASAI